jgi:hypothetical protein
MNSRTLGVFVLATGLLMGSAYAAEHDPHQNGQDHGYALVLDHGKKWTTDKTLRSGMSGIRSALAADLKTIQNGKAGAKTYDALSSQIDKQLVLIEQNCRLNPQADAMLHLILAEIMGGVETMRSKQTNMEKREGVFKVLDALDDYNRYFNHPGWQPIARQLMTNAHTGAASVSDSRINLNLTAEERAEFLAEMRNMLASIQGLMQGIGEGDRERIAAAARQSGNRMARATPVSVRAKLPQSFRDIGGPTHMMFEELAVRAETDDMDSLARDTADLMKQCLACHAAFRVR